MTTPIPILLSINGCKYVKFHPRDDTWHDDERPPRGMQRFSKWFLQRAGTKRSFLSDIDGVWHTTRGGPRALIFEFKPEGKSPWVPWGQEITLTFFSIFRGVQCLVVFAEGWDDESKEWYPGDAKVHLVHYRNGKRTDSDMTMEQFAVMVADWQVCEGPLMEAHVRDTDNAQLTDDQLRERILDAQAELDRRAVERAAGSNGRK